MRTMMVLLLIVTGCTITHPERDSCLRRGGKVIENSQGNMIQCAGPTQP